MPSDPGRRRSRFFHWAIRGRENGTLSAERESFGTNPLRGRRHSRFFLSANHRRERSTFSVERKSFGTNSLPRKKTFTILSPSKSPERRSARRTVPSRRFILEAAQEGQREVVIVYERDAVRCGLFGYQPRETLGTTENPPVPSASEEEDVRESFSERTTGEKICGENGTLSTICLRVKRRERGGEIV